MVITNRLGVVKFGGNPDVEDVESTFHFMVQRLKEWAVSRVVV